MLEKDLPDDRLLVSEVLVDFVDYADETTEAPSYIIDN